MQIMQFIIKILQNYLHYSKIFCTFVGFLCACALRVHSKVWRINDAEYTQTYRSKYNAGSRHGGVVVVVCRLR